MGKDRTQSRTPDLFSTASSPASSPPTQPPSSATTIDGAAIANSARHILPKDLPNAVKNLTDQELDLLYATVLAELQSRGKKPSSNANILKRRVEEVVVPLTTPRRR
jgi:hypothetical protein